MKMVRPLIPAWLGMSLIVAIACNSPARQPEAIPVYNNDSIKFYPVQQFLSTQIRETSATPFYIYQIREQDGKRDSLTVSRQEFLAATAIFTQFSFEDSTIKKYYKESAFNDQSTNSITLDYTTRNTQLPVQSASVLLDPETQQVKRVMMEVFESAGDSTITYRLGWKTNESCTIVKLVQKEGSPASAQSAQIVWNGN